MTSFSDRLTVNSPDGQQIVLTSCNQELYPPAELQEVETALRELYEVSTDIEKLVSQQAEQLDEAMTSSEVANEAIQEGTSTLFSAFESVSSKKRALGPILVGAGIGTVVAGPIGFLLTANVGVGLMCLAAGGGIGAGTSLLCQEIKNKLSL